MKIVGIIILIVLIAAIYGGIVLNSSEKQEEMQPEPIKAVEVEPEPEPVSPNSLNVFDTTSPEEKERLTCAGTFGYPPARCNTPEPSISDMAKQLEDMARMLEDYSKQIPIQTPPVPIVPPISQPAEPEYQPIFPPTTCYTELNGEILPYPCNLLLPKD